ncbi:MAG TPA: aminopeptidase [Clostridia bacterium]|nr:aminopeptidase [Clostridia bacterium]
MNQEMLEKYASVIVEVGANIREGDYVQIHGDTESLPLLRELVRACWQVGARDVVTRLADNEISLAKYEEANKEDLDYFPVFEAEYRESLLKARYHRIYVSAPSLDLFGHIDQSRIQRVQKTALAATEHLDKYMDSGEIKWVVAASPCARWAKAVYPNLSEQEALDTLWDLVFRICRVDMDDPVVAWKAHDSALKTREKWLDEQDFAYLHYEGPGTDLICHLADQHKWIGGSSVTPDGVVYIANIPTEEIFTTPHAMKVNGVVRSTKPLSVMGKIVEDFGFKFENGKVVDFYAGGNGDVLDSLLGMDEGARRLGEVALVPDSSPVSRSGILFKTTLYDENASCHFALGNAYAEAVRDGAKRTPEERKALGSNKSMIHIDFMVGGPELDITGYREDGTSAAVLRQGEWAF